MCESYVCFAFFSPYKNFFWFGDLSKHKINDVLKILKEVFFSYWLMISYILIDQTLI